MKETLVAATIIVAMTGLFGYHTIYTRYQVDRAHVLTELKAEQDTQRTAADVAQVLRQIEGLRQRVSPTGETSWLLNEVVKIADGSGVQLTRIDSEAPKAVGPYTRLAVSLQFTASYHELGSFLDRLEHGTPFLRVDSVRLSQAPSEARDGTAASVALVLSTLHVPSPLPLVAAGTGGSQPAR